MPQINARQPTGIVPWPLILLEGAEKAGKTYAAAQFTGNERVGQAYWLDIGEGSADEYGTVPGSDYLVLTHDGTWASILNQVEAVREEAARVASNGEKPVVLVIDSMTAEWDLLKDWASTRARSSRSNQEKLRKDPTAEVSVPMNLWNDSTARHRRLMTMLLTFPGIVVVTARGKEVASLDDNGRPVEGSKTYKVEAHKNLAFDATVWVRMSRDHAPTIVGARSVHAGIRPGVDRPQTAPSFSIDWLVFDVLKCDPQKAKVRDYTETRTDASDGTGETPAADTAPAGKPSSKDASGDVSRPVAGVLAAKNSDALGWWASKIEKNGHEQVNATSLVTVDDREALGLDADLDMTVGDLVAHVSVYVEKHGSGPRYQPEGAAG